MSEIQIQEQDDTVNIVVASIEPDVCKQFQEAAFQKYKQAVLNYGSKLWIEARGASLQRDPNANLIEITSPDVEAATIRTEMKLARLRQLRFPYRYIQQITSLAIGILIKLTFEAAGKPEGNFPLLFTFVLFLFGVIITLNYSEMREELLR
jgi:hypothetical protein